MVKGMVACVFKPFTHKGKGTWISESKVSLVYHNKFHDSQSYIIQRHNVKAKKPKKVLLALHVCLSVC